MALSAWITEIKKIKMCFMYTHVELNMFKWMLVDKEILIMKDIDIIILEIL